jgi:hypothetical protein
MRIGEEIEVLGENLPQCHTIPVTHIGAVSVFVYPPQKFK